MSAPEKIQSSTEHTSNNEALDRLASERHNQLRDALEENADVAALSNEQTSLESATRHALDTAPSIADTKGNDTMPAQKRRLITQQQRTIAFNKQMESVQHEMSSHERQFSKFIHNKPVEKTSDTLAATIARPNALLAGSICAFVLVTILYFIAKQYGYRLSGFETIAAFAFGWVLGIIYDYLHTLISGKRHR